jgi:hypothetical protein
LSFAAVKARMQAQGYFRTHHATLTQVRDAPRCQAAPVAYLKRAGLPEDDIEPDHFERQAGQHLQSQIIGVSRLV